MIGERVGGAVITGILGHGSQGTVYAARDAGGRDVAVKVLRVRERAAVERFFAEARAASSLAHPGIVAVHDYGVDEQGRAYVVMELLAGETLFDLLRRTSLDVSAAVAVLRAIATALAVAHERRDDSGARAPIAHRDLKPENIFLVPSVEGGTGGGARVVLVDFGVAKLGDARAATWSGAGAFGSPPYMAPEQWAGSGDVAADVYALGCLLHEMVAATPPFGFGPPAELMRAHREDTAPPLSECALDVPPALESLARRMLAKDPRERPASCAEIGAALDALPIAPRMPLPVVAAVRAFVPPSKARPSRLRALWRRVLETPSWAPGAAVCVLGSLLMGLCVVAGVADSFLAMPNWSFAYIVPVPLILTLSLRSAQRAAVFAREAGAMERHERIGALVVGLALALLPWSLFVSVAEWHARLGRGAAAGEWWALAPAAGALGATLQGTLIVVNIAFLVHALAWSHLVGALHDARRVTSLSSSRALDECTTLIVTTAALMELVNFLSSWQDAAAFHEVGLFALLVPPATFAELLHAGSGRYGGLIPAVGSGMELAFVVLALWTARRASVLPAAGLLALLFLASLFPWLGIPALLALAAAIARGIRASRVF